MVPQFQQRRLRDIKDLHQIDAIHKPCRGRRHEIRLKLNNSAGPKSLSHVQTQKKKVYIVMERLPGQSVSVGWTQRSAESKAKIFHQLQSMVLEMRNLQPPRDCGVSNVCGGPIFDPRLPNQAHWGPFRSTRDFHRELRNGIELNNVKDVNTIPAKLKELIQFHEQPWDKPVFTHGDLSSLNILADGDTIVGIIIWETAGWLPPYWEYTCAWGANPQNWFWQQEVDNFLVARPHDLNMETTRKKYFGDF